MQQTTRVVGIRDLRISRGHTLEAIAILSGVDPATVSRVERLEVAPKPETIVALAKALGISAVRLARMVKQ